MTRFIMTRGIFSPHNLINPTTCLGHLMVDGSVRYFPNLSGSSNAGKWLHLASMSSTLFHQRSSAKMHFQPGTINLDRPDESPIFLAYSESGIKEASDVVLFVYLSRFSRFIRRSPHLCFFQVNRIF